MPLLKKTKRRSGIPVHCGTRQTRLKARPAPDFTKLHNQWSEQCKQRKASKKPCTQIQEFHFATPGQRKEHKTEEKHQPRMITRHVASFKRLHPSNQGHPQGPRSDSSSSQPDEEFVAENESLQSILSNTGITMATVTAASERQTLAVAPTFKTPFAVNEQRHSVYYTGPRRGKRLSSTFSECRKPALSRLHPETTAAPKTSLLSPLTRGPIEVRHRQSIYRSYIYPEPPGGAGMSAVKSQDVLRTLPRARRVPVASASSPALRELSKSSSKKKVRWNDLARQNRLTPNSKKDTVVTMLTFNDDQSTGDSVTTQHEDQDLVDHEKERKFDNNQNKKSHSSAVALADELHQMEPVVECHNGDVTPRKAQLRLQPGSSSESCRNRPVPKHYFPNVLADVSNSPEGRLSTPGGIAGKLSSLQSEYLSAIKHEFVVLDDSGSKIYHARAVPETASDKENVSPYLTIHQQGRPPVCSDLEQDLSESVFEFERLECQVKKLRRRSEAVVAGGDEMAKRNIMEQLAMIKRKQEELIRLQTALQTQLSTQVRDSGSHSSTGSSPALISVTAPTGSEDTSLHCYQEGGIVSPSRQQRAGSEDDGMACARGTRHITELMRTVQLRTEDPVPTSGTPPDNRTIAATVPQSPVLIVTDNDGVIEVVTPPTIQQMELLGVPIVTPGFGHSLLPFPQSPLRNSHYSPFLTRINGSDGSLIYTPASHQGAEYYDQPVFSPKSRMAGSAQILSPIKDSFPIQLPLAMFSPSPVKHGRKLVPERGGKLPVANLSRRLHDFEDSMSPLPRVKQHSPLPRVVVPSVGALSLAGNLAPHHRQNTRHQGAKTSVHDRILGSAAHRYCEALLDEEVALFACRLHVTLGLAPLLISRCSDPVASVLDQGDDQHFVPICDSPSRSPPFSSAFSAFSDFTP